MRNFIIAALVVGILGAIGGVAYATIPDEDGVIHGCRNKASGLLRVINSATESCTSSERALNWNQQGPKGDPGGLNVYFNRNTDVLPAGTVRGYRAQCADGDRAIGGGYDSDSTEVTAFRSDVDLVNPAYVLGLNNRGAGAATIQFTAYCVDLTP
jgi:hypothetical protein